MDVCVQTALRAGDFYFDKNDGTGRQLQYRGELRLKVENYSEGGCQTLSVVMGDMEVQTDREEVE